MGRFFEARKHTIMARSKRVSKAFTRCSREIVIAVKAGGDNPDSNNDSLINAIDLLDLIPLYAQPFLPSADDLDSTNEIQSLFLGIKNHDITICCCHSGGVSIGSLAIGE